MAVMRYCARHGRFPRALGRCPACPPKRGTDTTARSAQRQFRADLIAQSDGRCGFTDANGVRCTVTRGLQAAHATGYAIDGNYASGAMLCSRHHRILDDRRTK